MMREETPRMIVILVWEQDADPSAVGTVTNIQTVLTPMAPHDTEEERAGRGHDSDVWKNPITVVTR